jgi:hypothetical protein
MSDFLFACPSVPVVRGSEVRFSVDEHRIFSLRDWPLSYQSCGEIIPVQPRLQRGIPTMGARYDWFNGIRIGPPRSNLTLGARTTYASSDGRIGPVERQRVGVASLTLGGRVRFKYWNDHAFWWWPMGDGGDQGDTAGFQFGYNLGLHQLSIGGWAFKDLSLTLRLATGIPNRNSAVPMGDGQVYSEVQFNDINRGDVDLNTTLSNRKAHNLTVGISVNVDAVRHATQDRLIHHTLGIPEFLQTGRFEVMMYMRVSGW